MKIDFICGDSAVILSGFPDEFVDLTVTSPPYSDLRHYNGFDWNFFEIAGQLYRVTKKGGVVVWVVMDKTSKGSESGDSFRQALYFMELGFNLHDTMIYQRWSGPLTHNRYEQEFEYMFVLSKGRPKTFNPIKIDCIHAGDYFIREAGKKEFRNDPMRRIRNKKRERLISKTRIDGNVWRLSNASQKKEFYGHPAPFPEELAHRHIISWSNEDDVVLDPFVGSGTSAAMAAKLKRNFVGIDVSLDYLKIAQERVERYRD